MRTWNERCRTAFISVGYAGVMQRWMLAAECLFLFLALPLAYRFSPVKIPPLPLLWAAAGYGVWRMMGTPGFKRLWLWNASALRGHIVTILAPWLGSALVLWLAVRWLAPHLQWEMARRNPALWALVMVLYPILSVYPQGLVYRAFFFTRYAALFPNRWAMIVASAVAFAFLHIIFRNSIAVSLTFCGGLLFAYRYAETGSLMTSSLEHALYGCWLFTVGLGQYFFHGTSETVQTAMR